MKVKELIAKLQEFDGKLKVKQPMLLFYMVLVAKNKEPKN
jgi:hypothetical protein